MINELKTLKPPPVMGKKSIVAGGLINHVRMKGLPDRAVLAHLSDFAALHHRGKLLIPLAFLRKAATFAAAHVAILTLCG
jgi:hypothetical protein